MQSIINQFSVAAQVADYIADLSLSDLAPLTISRYAACLRSYASYLGIDGVPSEYTAKSFIGQLRARGLSSRRPSPVYLASALRPCPVVTMPAHQGAWYQCHACTPRVRPNPTPPPAPLMFPLPSFIMPLFPLPMRIILFDYTPLLLPSFPLLRLLCFL